MNGAIEIKLACSLRDVDQITPLFDAYRVFYEQPSDLEASYRFLRERWQLRETVLYFASLSEMPVGFVQLFPSFVSDRMRRFWILNDLFVDPAHRKNGIARLLMQRAERHAQETSAIGLTLSTAVGNVNAQSLYSSERYVRDADSVVFRRYFEK